MHFPATRCRNQVLRNLRRLNQLRIATKCSSQIITLQKNNCVVFETSSRTFLKKYPAHYLEESSPDSSQSISKTKIMFTHRSTASSTCYELIYMLIYTGKSDMDLLTSSIRRSSSGDFAWCVVKFRLAVLR